jgi:TetR/AcrR family transcriptional regulator
MTAPADRERNPVRTRAAILDAAEKLFAQKGFEATSLSEVGAAAGVSRGTPGYFFGSKADLYQAVLDRSLAEVREAVRAGRERALASGQTTDAILAGAVSNFIRLIEREALGGGPQHDELGPLSAGQEALAAISAELGLDDSPSGEAAQVLLSIIALCWFHLIHARTVAPAVGVTLEDAQDLERRRRHVVGLVLHGVAGLERPLTPTLTRSSDHD